MRQAGGYAVISSPDAATVNLDHFQRREIKAGSALEVDTFTCGHCGAVTHVLAKMSMDDLGSMCRCCMKMVCRKCADKGCTPLEKKLEFAEKRDRALKSYGF